MPFLTVCPTEIPEFAALVGDFPDRDAVVLGGATDNELGRESVRVLIDWRRAVPVCPKARCFVAAAPCRRAMFYRVNSGRRQRIVFWALRRPASVKDAGPVAGTMRTAEESASAPKGAAELVTVAGDRAADAPLPYRLSCERSAL